MALVTLPLTIPAGQALSDPLQLSTGLRLARIGMPPDWDAAPISFVISPDGTNWWDVHHVVQSVDGPWSAYEVSVSRPAPGAMLLLPVDLGANVAWIKFRSGTKSKPVNQAADRTFNIVFA